MKKTLNYSLLAIILTGVTILCCVRWKVWFGNPPEPVWTEDTIPFRFHTFADDSIPRFTITDNTFINTNSPDTLRFIVLGDVHNGIDSVLWEKMWQRHSGIDFYAQLGDFIDRGYFYYYELLVKEIHNTHFADLPVIVTPGNHEYRKGFVKCLPPIWIGEWWRNPLNGPERYKGRTFYVDFPNLRFIAIDTNGLQKLSDYTVVLTWLNMALDSAEDKFKLVIMHHPVYSGAYGRVNIGEYAAFRRALQKADVVFSGHDHNYYRRLPFVGTTSTAKHKLSKVNSKHDRIGSGRQMYELCTIISDTLNIQTYLMKEGLLYDEFNVICTTDSNNIKTHQYFVSEPCLEEIVDIPDKYKNKTNSIKIKIFNKRLKQRKQK